MLRDGRPATILDSYEAERRPLVREVIAITKGLGQIICERDPARAAARNAAMLADMAAGRGNVIRQSLFPPIADGIIARQPDGRPVAGAGQPAPQPWLREGSGPERRLDDVLPSGFRLLMHGGTALPALARPLARALGVSIHTLGRDGSGAETITECHGVLHGWLEAQDAAGVLLRPDHMVFGTGKTGADLHDLLVQLNGHMGAAAA